MKISASNIAWNEEDDEQVYSKLKDEGFSAIEVAPTRLISKEPYHPSNIQQAESIARVIQQRWGLGICSMQSLWFGLTERMFGTREEREFLFRYTCAALDFANAISCPHVVFGNPRNRVIDQADQWEQGRVFFDACAAYASTKEIVIGIEANPATYGTNYLNHTYEALRLVQEVDSPSFKLNLDLGTILLNEEGLCDIANWLPYVSHVHISEPMLSPVTIRPEHIELADILRESAYEGWVSLEMKNSGTETLFDSLEVVAGTFGS